MNNNLVSNEDIAIMVDKLKKKREGGRMRAQKWYDIHKDELKQQRLLKKLENKSKKRPRKKIIKRK